MVKGQLKTGLAADVAKVFEHMKFFVDQGSPKSGITIFDSHAHKEKYFGVCGFFLSVKIAISLLALLTGG